MRIDTEIFFLRIAKTLSERASCCRRDVGCVLVDKYNHIISTGYNGTAAGLKNCTKENPCSDEARDADSGCGLDLCEAIHAEQNALLQCPDINRIKIAYITASPCVTCVKLLLNTSCEEIIFMEEYPHLKSKNLWSNANRKWTQINDYTVYGRL